MSSCFLCDTSYKFRNIPDRYNVVVSEGEQRHIYMKYMPIMVGSSGTNTNDQQHTNGNTQNYVSYIVKKLEFRSNVREGPNYALDDYLNVDYIIIFKVPFREIIFDYYFTTMNNFILYSEPETILGYCVCPRPTFRGNDRQHFPAKYDITINKPFIVGPNDYVGVLYFFAEDKIIDASVKVWFDVV